MAEYTCICGKTVEIKDGKRFAWCDWCGERVFPEYLALYNAVVALERRGKGAVSPADLCKYHESYLKLGSDPELAALGFSPDRAISRKLLERAAEVLDLAMIWCTLGESYTEAAIGDRRSWFGRGIDTRPKDNVYRKFCLCHAARIDSELGERAYNPYGALGCYLELFELEPNNADIAMYIYRAYKFNGELERAEFYLKHAEALGSYDAAEARAHEESLSELVEMLGEARRKAEAAAAAAEIDDEIMDGRASAIMRK